MLCGLEVTLGDLEISFPPFALLDQDIVERPDALIPVVLSNRVLVFIEERVEGGLEPGPGAFRDGLTAER